VQEYWRGRHKRTRQREKEKALGGDASGRGATDSQAADAGGETTHEAAGGRHSLVDICASR
jgi:hypothetical protein